MRYAHSFSTNCGYRNRIYHPRHAPPDTNSYTTPCLATEIPANVIADDGYRVPCVNISGTVPFGITVIQMLSCSGGVSMYNASPPGRVSLPSLRQVTGGEVGHFSRQVLI